MEVLTSTITESVFTIVGVLIAAVVYYLSPKLKRQLAILADKDNSGIVENVVDMGVELAEKELTGKEGEEKFNHAAEYVAKMANRYGIDISDDFIKGAVQKGYKRMIRNDGKDDK